MTPEDRYLCAELGELNDAAAERAINRIKALSAEVDRLRQERDNGEGAYQTLANIADTCRARGFESDVGAVDERVIALAQERDALKAEVETVNAELSTYKLRCFSLVSKLPGHTLCGDIQQWAIDTQNEWNVLKAERDRYREALAHTHRCLSVYVNTGEWPRAEADQPAQVQLALKAALAQAGSDAKPAAQNGGATA